VKHGIVESVGTNSLNILVDDDGTMETCDVHPQALISLNRKWVKLSELKAGDEVTLNGIPPVNSVRATRT